MGPRLLLCLEDVGGYLAVARAYMVDDIRVVATSEDVVDD